MAEEGECSAKPDKNTEKDNNYDAELDFLSESFNATKALNTPGVVPPVKDAKTYDNLYKFESEYFKKDLLQKTAEKRDAKNKAAASSSGQIERKFLPHQMPIKTKRPQKLDHNVFSKMQDCPGPLQMLKQCVDEEIRVKVLTRHLRGIRGFIIGTVVLFDKHWNMCLKDVDEVWTRKKKTKVPAISGPKPTKEQLDSRPVHPPKITVLKSTKKTELCSRRIDQLIIRGEQVAVVIVLKNRNNEEEPAAKT